MPDPIRADTDDFELNAISFLEWSDYRGPITVVAGVIIVPPLGFNLLDVLSRLAADYLELNCDFLTKFYRITSYPDYDPVVRKYFGRRSWRVFRVMPDYHSRYPICS